MKGVRNTSEGIRVVTVPDAEAGSDRDRAVLEVVSSSICGTDVGFIAMGLTGFTLGHEFAGVADGVAYAVEPAISCGECEECRAGFTQRCRGEHANLGIFIDGGLTERIVIPRDNLVALPPGLDPVDACLVEPAAVALHGVYRAAVSPGERVAVVGGGSLGLLAVAVLRAFGHECDLEARYRHQREVGERFGAGQPSSEYDIVIDAAGSESGLVRAAELARPGGRVVLLGVYPQHVPVPGTTTLTKELSWVGAMAYGRQEGIREVDRAAELLAAYPEIALALITHRFPLDDAPEAFRVAGDRASGAIKVALHP
jgi:2-desacetyl-2-hydroxyethyl bacteriochlorophyllide A dehydrogenase